MDIFYAYVTLFRDLGIHLPFSKFQMGILKALNFCPTQLHLNEWDYMQAFCVVYMTLLLTPAFLYFFRAIPSPTKSWISLALVKNKKLFTLFNSSYKDFKCNFFKIAKKDSSRSSYYSNDGLPKFPFLLD